MVSNYQLDIARRAKTDIRHISSYTQERWGQKQRATYKAMLNKALKTIAENPERGRERHGVMVYPVGKHCIFYRIKGVNVYVLRILHQRMDALQHLPW